MWYRWQKLQDQQILLGARMSYSILADIYLETGMSLGSITEDDVTNMIVRSDEDIVAYLSAKGYPAPTANNNLKTASINFTKVRIIDRLSIELARPSTLTLTGDLSFSVSQTEAKRFTASAYAAIESYIASANSSFTYICITPNADDPYLDLR